jgi:tetratricopeptide (TPR) repeat protein
MKRAGLRIPTILLLAAVACLSQQTEQLRHTTSDGRLAPILGNLGTLHMSVTTKHSDAQKFFDQGVRLLYGFNHAEALRSFREAARIDDSCAMAFWGQALALAPNINDSAIGPDREQQGYDAIREALKRRRNANAKEQALIDALAVRFAEKPTEGERQALNQAYASAMKKVRKRFPKDPDVAVLYADAVMNTRPWDYWTKDGKPQPGIHDAKVTLEQTMQRFPDHPGALHIYIHLVEASDHVDQAVSAADRLGSLMPGAGHIVHMPSHVYIRVGRYGDAADANVKAIKADEAYITQCRAQGIYPAGYYPHNVHFLAAAVVMEGRRDEALRAARKAASIHNHDVPEGLVGFAHLLEALPSLVMVRFGQWGDILTMPKPSDGRPFVSAMHHFARGMALSATGKPEGAEAELAALEAIAHGSAIKAFKILDVNSLGDIAPIGVAMLRGDIAEKARAYAIALREFRRAVELEDSLLYSEPPEWFLQPRQYLGNAYLQAGKHQDAERVFRADLRRHRGNGWALRGLEQSLRMQGRTAEANDVSSQFARAWKRADIELTTARF